MSKAERGFTDRWEYFKTSGGTCIPLEFNEHMSGAGVSSQVDVLDSRVEGWGAGVEETVEIRRRDRTPPPGRSGRTLHPATSRRQSADGDKLAETKPLRKAISVPTCG